MLKLRFFFFNHVVNSLNDPCYNKHYATDCDQILDFSKKKEMSNFVFRLEGDFRIRKIILVIF